ncbi:MAG: hypothetical protein ABIN79_07365 [Marmoricola sp.]
MRSTTATATAHQHRSVFADIVVGTATIVGLMVTSAIVSVTVAGFFQWTPNVSPILDDGLPLALLVAGMVLSGRVAVDIAGGLGIASAALSAMLVLLIGYAVERSSEAHGDGLEIRQVMLAALVVLVVVGGTAFLIDRRRRRSTQPG